MPGLHSLTTLRQMDARQLWRFLRFVAAQYSERGCRQQAAALTYMTLFAIVPTMTVIFTMFSLFPAFEGMAGQLEGYLFQYLLPDSGLDVREYLTEFTTQARSLTLAGILMLVVTAYLMMKSIESTFNDIWGVIEARRGLSNFLLYWAVLSLGPLLLGLGLAISTFLLSLQYFVDDYDSLGIVPTVFGFFPWLLTCMAFTLLFVAVPNCKVPFKDALVGGVLTAICFELFKDLFGLIVANSSYKAVYGAFAMVPLFLLWIYILWMIVLAGAVLVRALSAYQGTIERTQHSDLIAALQVLWQLRQGAQIGRPISLDQLLAVGVESEQWRRLRNMLQRQGIITLTQNSDYVLCRDLETLSLQQLASLTGVGDQLPPSELRLDGDPWFKAVSERLQALDRHRHREFDVSVESLLRDDHEEDRNVATSPRLLKP